MAQNAFSVAGENAAIPLDSQERLSCLLIYGLCTFLRSHLYARLGSYHLAGDSASLNYPTLQRCVVYTKTGRESACGYDEQRYTVRVFFLVSRIDFPICFGSGAQ